MNLLIDGRKIGLSERELAIFAALYNARGDDVAYGEISRAVWRFIEGYARHGQRQAVYLAIHQLKVKLWMTRFTIMRTGASWRLIRLPLYHRLNPRFTMAHAP